MASTKVLLRSAKKLKNGEAPIVLRFIKDRKTKFIYTGLHCPVHLWDFNKNKPSKKHPNFFELELFISNKINEAQNIVLGLENQKEDYGLDNFLQKYKVKKKEITVLKFIDQIIEQELNSNKVGNAKIYKDLKRALIKFKKGVDFQFTDIDYTFLKKFERDFLERGVLENSIGLYMSRIRAVFNRAIQEGYCRKELYPFDKYKISSLNTQTTKRALTKEQMQEIVNLELDNNSKLNDSKKIFLFSFYTRGMNFKDMALLKWKDISDNRVTYKRAKTSQLFNIKLHQPALEILKYYRQFTGGDNENYVFQYLNPETHLTPSQIDGRIRKTNKKVNKDLKEIAKLAKIDFTLTTYVARHSYATIMKKNGTSISIISELLGHHSEKITQVYLDKFDNQVLDDADIQIL